MKIEAEKVSRIEAARRQLDAAIQIWLADHDVFAVHTIVMASYGLLKDLSAAKDAAFHQHADRLIKETMGHEVFRQVSNQLKHADRDTDSPVRVPSHEFNESVIGGALVFFRTTTGDVSELMGAFHLMMLTAHSDIFNVMDDPDPDVEEGARNFGRLLREDISFRRLTVEANLSLIRAGHIPRNTNLRRRNDDPRNP